MTDDFPFISVLFCFQAQISGEIFLYFRYELLNKWDISPNISKYENNFPIFTENCLVMRGMDMNLFDENLKGEKVDRLGNNLVVLENPKLDRQTDFPFRSDTTISVIVMGGSMECIADMAAHRIDVCGMLVILPSQIVEKISFSDDFRGYCILMSTAFLETLPIGNRIPLTVDVRRHGFYPMDADSAAALENYVKMLQGALRSSSNYRHEIASHLTAAYYYGLGTYIHGAQGRDVTVSRYEEITDEFLRLVRDNCNVRRDMEFYASSLCLSAKHVSLAVRTVTGDSAMKWIERYTVLAAKSLLKTSSLSVGEISDRLNFPTPSDFGKYFRKFTGYSPRAFRKA